MTSVFAGVCLFIGYYVTVTTTSKHFDHGMERVLFSIQYAPRMKLTFQARAGSINHQHHQQQQQHHQAQMIVHDVVFPHTIQILTKNKMMMMMPWLLIVVCLTLMMVICST
jgi:hypothetical protein